MPGPYAFATDRAVGTPAPAADHNGVAAALNEAAVIATPNVLALRDANGRMQAEDPSADEDVATKGWVTTQNGFMVPKSLLNQKGDMFVALDDDTVDTIGVSGIPDGYVFTRDAAAGLGVKWAPPAGEKPNVNRFILGRDGGVVNYYTWPNISLDGGVNATTVHLIELYATSPMRFDRFRVNRNGADTAANELRAAVYGNPAGLFPTAPNGDPIWTSSLVDSMAAGQYSFTVSPAIDLDAGESVWIALSYVRATTGELSRMTYTTVYSPAVSPWYVTDWNAAIGYGASNLRRQGWFQHAALVAGAWPNINPANLTASGVAPRVAVGLMGL